MNSFLRNIIYICTIGILFTPLLFDKSNLYSYAFFKTFLFSIFVEISFASYLVLQFRDQRYRCTFKNPIIRVHGVFLATLILVTFTGVDWMRSLWSTPMWMTGVVTYIHLFLWLVILTSVFRRWEEWRQFLWASLSVCVFVILYGLGQRLHLEGFGAEDFGSRMASTLGNPNYLSTYVLLNLFFTLLLFFKEKVIFLKSLLPFFCLFLLFGLVSTGGRAWIVVLALSSSIFFFITIFYYQSSRLRLIYFSILVLLMSGGIGIFLWLNTPYGQNWVQTTLPTSTHRMVLSLFVDQGRQALWRIGWMGFLDHPLFGWGPNNFQYVFTQYVHPLHQEALFSHQWYSQAHNQIVDTMATMGVVGTVTYISIWIVVWWLIGRNIYSSRDLKERVFFTIIALFFFVYFVNNLFSFDTIGPLIMLYMGFGIAIVVTEKRAEYSLPPDPGNKKTTFSTPRIFLLFSLAGVMVVMTYVNIIPYLQLRTTKNALDILPYNFAKGFSDLKNVASSNTYVLDTIWMDIAPIAYVHSARYVMSGVQRKEILQFAISEMEKTLKSHPLSMEYALSLIRLYEVYSDYSPDILTRAESVSSRLMRQYPNRRDILFASARIARVQKKYELAHNYAQKLIDLQWSRGDVHFLMAQILADMGGEFNKIYESIDNAEKLGYPIFKNGSLYFILAQKASKKDIPRLLEYVNRGWNEQAQTFEYAAARALLMQRSGRYKEAARDLTWLRERNPEFLEKIEKLVSKK